MEELIIIFAKNVFHEGQKNPDTTFEEWFNIIMNDNNNKS